MQKSREKNIRSNGRALERALFSFALISAQSGVGTTHPPPLCGSGESAVFLTL
nr:MAG TPA: hypothetical protein [Caudoviricetes sp.]